eukprot:m.84618 g.84618  ORF g.84618 m.84618 type:complete len:390 (-) comp8208_c0_seq1:875-2044(-)
MNAHPRLASALMAGRVAGRLPPSHARQSDRRVHARPRRRDLARKRGPADGRGGCADAERSCAHPCQQHESVCPACTNPRVRRARPGHRRQRQLCHRVGCCSRGHRRMLDRARAVPQRLLRHAVDPADVQGRWWCLAPVHCPSLSEQHHWCQRSERLRLPPRHERICDAKCYCAVLCQLVQSRLLPGEQPRHQCPEWVHMQLRLHGQRDGHDERPVLCVHMHPNPVPRQLQWHKPAPRLHLLSGFQWNHHAPGRPVHPRLMPRRDDRFVSRHRLSVSRGLRQHHRGVGRVPLLYRQLHPRELPRDLPAVLGRVPVSCRLVRADERQHGPPVLLAQRLRVLHRRRLKCGRFHCLPYPGYILVDRAELRHQCGGRRDRRRRRRLDEHNCVRT